MAGPVITVSGPHGTGKSTYARGLAKALRLRYVCAGELFRELAKEREMSLGDFGRLAAQDPSIDKMIDERTKAEAGKGGVVIDAQLAAWMVGDLADVKLLLTAPDDVRFRRIAERDGTSFEAARKETMSREEIQRQRYRRYYDVNVADLSIYDLKIDTSQDSVEKTTERLVEVVRDFLAKRNA